MSATTPGLRALYSISARPPPAARPSLARDVTVVDHESLRDGPDAVWPEQLVARTTAAYVTAHDAAVVLTFDGYGVSGHPNHIAVHRGIKWGLQPGRPCAETGAVFLELLSLPVAVKFLGLLEAAMHRHGCVGAEPGGGGGAASASATVHFFAGPADVAAVWAAMRAHWSQLVWFRRLYLVFSRYVYVNSFRLLG